MLCVTGICPLRSVYSPGLQNINIITVLYAFVRLVV